MQRGLIGISLEAYWYAAIRSCNYNIRIGIYQLLHFSLRSMGMPVGIVLTSKMGSFISTRAPFIMCKDSSAQVRDVWYECRVIFFIRNESCWRGLIIFSKATVVESNKSPDTINSPLLTRTYFNLMNRLIAGPIKRGMKIFTHSKTSMAALLKCRNAQVISSHTL